MINRRQVCCENRMGLVFNVSLLSLTLAKVLKDTVSTGML